MRTTEQMAKTLLAQRITRSKLLGSLGRCSEPCWLILLRIYSEQSTGNTTVGNVTSALGYAKTTMLRYLSTLEDQNFITSHEYVRDGRARMLKLTPSTKYAVEHILAKIVQE
jgi:DNA-binding MarR family transcriptional regulator